MNDNNINSKCNLYSYSKYGFRGDYIRYGTIFYNRQKVSEGMKLIIDITEAHYELLKWVSENGMINVLQKKVINGTPLDKIRAEVADTFIKHGLGNTVICFDVLKIIDRKGDKE